MTTLATIVCVVLGLGVALLAGIQALRNQGVRYLELAAAAATEVGVLFYVGVRTADLAGGHHTSSLGLTIAYLIGIALVMPITAVLASAEPTRWGAVVLGVGGLVVCVLLARIAQLWHPHG